jgi:hypothetical protein
MYDGGYVNFLKKMLVGNYCKGVMCETLTRWEERENVFCCEINCDDVNWIGLPVESIDRLNCNGEKHSAASWRKLRALLHSFTNSSSETTLVVLWLVSWM